MTTLSLPALTSPVVYTLYDRRGKALYVGSTGNLIARLQQHAKVQPWWPDVSRVWVDGPYGTRAAARSAEQAAINRSAPTQNQMRAHGTASKKSFRISNELWSAFVEGAHDEGTTAAAIVDDYLRQYVAECPNGCGCRCAECYFGDHCSVKRCAA